MDWVKTNVSPMALVDTYLLSLAVVKVDSFVSIMMAIIVIPKIFHV